MLSASVDIILARPLFTCTVPQPILEIGAVQSDTYVAAMSFNLQCSITLDGTVDTAVGVTVTWQMNGADLTDTVRVTASQPQQPALPCIVTVALWLFTTILDSGTSIAALHV